MSCLSCVICIVGFWIRSMVECFGFPQSPRTRPYCLGLEDWREPPHSETCWLVSHSCWTGGVIECLGLPQSPRSRPYCPELEDCEVPLHSVSCCSYVGYIFVKFYLKYIQYFWIGGVIEFLGLSHSPRPRPYCPELEDCEVPLHSVSCCSYFGYIIAKFYLKYIR